MTLDTCPLETESTRQLFVFLLYNIHVLYMTVFFSGRMHGYVYRLPYPRQIRRID